MSNAQKTVYITISYDKPDPFYSNCMCKLRPGRSAAFTIDDPETKKILEQVDVHRLSKAEREDEQYCG